MTGRFIKKDGLERTVYTATVQDIKIQGYCILLSLSNVPHAKSVNIKDIYDGNCLLEKVTILSCGSIEVDTEGNLIKW